MKYGLLFFFSFLSLWLMAQQDSLGREIEPGMETSFENYEVLIIAVLGLLLLIGLRFWFRRTRKHKVD
ncbi:MAG: hypothetical protein EON98_10095 [Chitinophagaceae bacterium]|nr:MAG: hypothetical protein EON98_10095 [Chitinophagaceae bacterium]